MDAEEREEKSRETLCQDAGTAHTQRAHYAISRSSSNTVAFTAPMASDLHNLSH